MCEVLYFADFNQIYFRAGRRHFTGMDDILEEVNTAKYINKILDNASQSITMMEIFSKKVALNDCCNEMFQSLCSEDIDSIIRAAQHSPEWLKYRKFRITGSRCYSLYTYSKNDWETKTVKYFYKHSFTNKFVKHGLKWESQARTVFKDQTKSGVFECGMVVSHSNPWLGFSPDGVIMENDRPHQLLEIKCIFEGATKTIAEAVKTAKYLIQENGKYKLKKNHQYYGQVQMGMAILNLQKAILFIFASFDDSGLIVEVDFDYEFSKKMILTIKERYFENMLHVLCTRSDL